MVVGTPKGSITGEGSFKEEVKDLAEEGKRSAEEAEYAATKAELERFLDELEKQTIPELEEAVEEFCKEEAEAAQASK